MCCTNKPLSGSTTVLRCHRVATIEVEQTNDVRRPTEVADTVITESGDLRRSTRMRKPLVKLNL